MILDSSRIVSKDSKPTVSLTNDFAVSITYKCDLLNAVIYSIVDAYYNGCLLHFLP